MSEFVIRSIFNFSKSDSLLGNGGIHTNGMLACFASRERPTVKTVGVGHALKWLFLSSIRRGCSARRRIEDAKYKRPTKAGRLSWVRRDEYYGGHKAKSLSLILP